MAGSAVRAQRENDRLGQADAGPGAGSDSELTPGARNGVQVCLRIQPSEKVTVITDEASLEIAAAIVRELESVGSPYHAFVLEELAERPLVTLPQEILDDLETSKVSIF